MPTHLHISPQNVFHLQVNVADMKTRPPSGQLAGDPPLEGWERVTRTVRIIVVARSYGAAECAVLAHFAGGFVLAVMHASGYGSSDGVLIDSDMIPWAPATATSP